MGIRVGGDTASLEWCPLCTGPMDAADGACPHCGEAMVECRECRQPNPPATERCSRCDGELGA